MRVKAGFSKGCLIEGGIPSLCFSQGQDDLRNYVDVAAPSVKPLMPYVGGTRLASHAG